LYDPHPEDVTLFVLPETWKTSPSPAYSLQRYYRIALEQQYYPGSSVILSSSTLPFAGNFYKSHGKLDDDPVLGTGIALVLSVGILGACTKKEANKSKDVDNKTEQKASKKKVVATSTMLTDLVKQIGGDNFEVEGMMKAGVDPHLYKPTAGDVDKLEKADVVVVNGLHLEGQMGEILQGLEKQNKNVVTAAKNIPSDKLLPWDEEGAGPNDPHIWFSVQNWKIAAKNVAEGLKKADSSKAEEIDKNLAKYEKELDELSEYIKKKVSELPENQRVLVTAHDAFNYFAKEWICFVK